MVGTERAPKITGMIIDLPEAELFNAVASLENLENKVRVADTLLQNVQNQQKQNRLETAVGYISAKV